MNKTIAITIKDKIAEAANEALYVCGNSDFVINFAFDDEWEEFPTKTARFIYNGKHEDVIFDGKLILIYSSMSVQESIEK